MKLYRYFKLDIGSSFLVILLVLTTAFRLEITNWTTDLGITGWLGILGSFLGFSLGYSFFNKTVIKLLGFFYSILILPWYLSSVITGEITLLDRMISLLGRFSASISLLINGKKVDDYLFFVILMSILFWLIGLISAYELIRNREILRVILPSLIPLLVIQYYDSAKPGRIWGLAIYLFFSLILTGRINLLKSRERWEKEGVLAGEEPEFDLNKHMIKIAAILVLIAFMIPLPSVLIPAAVTTWKKINDPFYPVQERFADLFAALKSERTIEKKGEIFGDNLGLGRIAGKGETQLLKVIASDPALPRQYWRMRVYDTYNDSTWQVNKGVNVEFDPEKGSFAKSDTIIPPETEFSIIWRTSQSSFLVIPQQSIWVSRKSTIQVDGNAGSDTDPFSWKVSPVVQDGDLYKVRALLYNPTQAMLRKSESNYPKWIKDRYLQIPEKIKSNIKPLAEEITSGLVSEFDKAAAVTNYLRKTMHYNDVVPDPKAGEDPIVWFIMTNKSGFCNYYASADVLLLRSIGIPARLVVGFSQGLNENPREYIVRGKDTHAWLEVFFSGVGWVQFEPTTIQPEIVLPLGLESSQSAKLENPSNEGAINKNKAAEDDTDAIRVSKSHNTLLLMFFARWKWPLLAVLSVIILISIKLLSKKAGKRFVRSRIPSFIKTIFNSLHFSSPVWLEHWIKWEQVSPVERAFHSVNQVLGWMKRPPAVNVTPAERARAVKELIPEASQEVDKLLSSLEITLFHNGNVDILPAEKASRTLRYKTIRKIINERFFGV